MTRLLRLANVSHLRGVVFNMPVDFPRQHQPAVSAMRRVRRAVRYTAAIAWTLTLGVSANAVMFWIVDQVLSNSQ
jgi:hypothetical protein